MQKFLSLFLIFSLFVFFPGNNFAKSTGKTANDFTLNSIDGDIITLSSLKGKKVLIDFFATWCPPCKNELKEINKIVEKYPPNNNNYQILCVSVDNSIGKVRSFINKKGYKMKVLFDDQNIASDYGVRGIPALFLIDEDGKLAWSHVGFADGSTIKNKLGLK